MVSYTPAPLLVQVLGMMDQLPLVPLLVAADPVCIRSGWS